MKSVFALSLLSLGLNIPTAFAAAVSEPRAEVLARKTCPAGKREEAAKALEFPGLYFGVSLHQHLPVLTSINLDLYRNVISISKYVFSS